MKLAKLQILKQEKKIALEKKKELQKKKRKEKELLKGFYFICNIKNYTPWLEYLKVFGFLNNWNTKSIYILRFKRNKIFIV